MAEQTLLADHTPLEAIVSIPRALHSLKAAGFATIGDVRRRGLAAVSGVKYVGAASIDALCEQLSEPQGADEEVAVGKEARHEEGEYPISLQSPHHALRLAWSPARKITYPDGSYEVQDTLFVEFVGGTAKITQQMYLMRKYKRDEARISKAIEEKEPWRLECVELIRRMSNFNIDFFLLDD